MSTKIISGQFFIPQESSFFYQVTLGHEETDDRILLDIEATGETAQAKALAKALEEEFQLHFFGVEGAAYDRFEETLKKVNERAAGLLEGISAHIAVAVMSGDELHLTQAGDAEVYLVRGGKLTVVSEGLGSKESTDLFENIASGELKGDDRVVLTTKRLLREMTASQISKIFSEGVAEAIELLKAQLESGDEVTGVGVMAMHLKLLEAAKPTHNEYIPLARIRPAFENAWLEKGYELLAHIPPLAKRYFDLSVEKIVEKTGQQHDIVRKNALGVIALIGIILLILAVSSLSIDSTKQAKFAEYKAAIQTIQQDLNTAETRALMDDINSANAILTKVEMKAQEILTAGMFRTEAMAVLDRVQQERDKINFVTRVKAEKAVFADISMKNPTVKLQGLVSLKDHLFANSDTQLFETVMNQVNPPLKLHESEKVVASTVMEDKETLLYQTNGGKLLEVRGNDVTSVKTEDPSWKSGTQMRGFGRFLYILDAKGQQVWKYERKRDLYGPVSAYAESGSIIVDSLDIAIDGFMFVLEKGGNVKKFLKGKVQEFTPTQIPGDVLSTATRIFTMPDQTRLYFLDPSHSRVIVTTKGAKEARYKRQIIFEGAEKLVDLYVDQAEHKLYVLGEKKIYEIDL